MNKLLALLSVVALFSCRSDMQIMPSLDDRQECIDNFLVAFGMSEYNGAPIPCGQSYLVLYEDADQVFALLHNDCADLPPQVLEDCAGNELCVYVTEAGCLERVQQSVRVGIIGVAD